MANSLSKIDRRKSVNYLVRIISDRIKPEVKAWVPQNIQMNIESSWDAPFADIGSGKIGTALSLFGFSLKNRVATTQVWGGSAPLTLTLPLQFIAIDNARNDVKSQVNRLIRMTVPGIGAGGFYQPPGPTLYDIKSAIKEAGRSLNQGFLTTAADNLRPTQGDKITVAIGEKFLLFKNVVIVSVVPDFTMKLAEDGTPIEATVELTFRTYTTPSKEDINQIFMEETDDGTAQIQ